MIEVEKDLYCCCGKRHGTNAENCERCALLREVETSKLQVSETTFDHKLENYLYARLRQYSGRYERGDLQLLPEWVPSRIRLEYAIHAEHPNERGFILAGDHDCVCGPDGRIFVDSCTNVRVRIPVCECQILAFAMNGRRAIVQAELALKMRQAADVIAGVYDE